ncbi:MAG: hypothetical protein AW09_001533 [Candidatus Accumulibacter phosphatis]|uniref:Uncharacterized protein n=1 Tax=Candidatus Accumulibacter phosphatis TaxID=327160 RepID=A0A080LWR4_9PROT|nr:MAG: hypothetical protein AW09_001533 [Candidatus Accumulibacter phosphatis]
MNGCRVSLVVHSPVRPALSSAFSCLNCRQARSAQPRRSGYANCINSGEQVEVGQVCSDWVHAGSGTALESCSASTTATKSHI